MTEKHPEGDVGFYELGQNLVGRKGREEVWVGRGQAPQEVRHDHLSGLLV